MTFKKIKNYHELSEALGVQTNSLYHYANLNDKSKYHSFTIKKRNGSDRRIEAPCEGLKHIQRKISDKLYESYKPRSCNHGAVLGHGIKDNATGHIGKRIIINIDLKDFFNSIKAQRIYGLFKGTAFEFSTPMSMAIRDLTCHKGILPQGSPSSPILANMLAKQLDNHLIQYAKENNFFYSRYYDDLTFSTNDLRSKTAIITNSRGVGLSIKHTLNTELVNIIRQAGFEVNINKIKFVEGSNSKFVTGVKVNEKHNVSRNYVRQIRVMLHHWEKLGYEEANKENQRLHGHTKDLRNQLQGRLAHLKYIRHTEDRRDYLYEKYKEKLEILKKRDFSIEP